MKFGPISTAESCGAILAHSLRAGGVKWKKGRVLSEQDARELAAAGVSEVVAARMESGDVGEDAAAERVGKKIAGLNVRAAKPLAGRVNFFAEVDGILQFHPDTVAAMNRASSEVALAALSPDSRARTGALIGTLKIIPFAVADSVLQKCEAAADVNGVLSVAPFIPRRAVLIQTVLPGMSDHVLEKTHRITRTRLAELRCELAGEKRCAHRADAIVAAMRESRDARPRLYLIAGASAICDARDEIPAAAMLFGADKVRVGMPADPGNLLAFARAGDADIVGMPGCARSPKWNGLDLVLARVCAELPPSDDDIAAMGVGGLFSEIAERPAPRAPRSMPPKICAVLLAAGASRRMGENKLLTTWRDDAPLIHGAARALALAKERGTIAEVIAVIGRDAEKMREVLRGFDFRIAENPDYREGMSSSLRAGVARIPADADAALIALGDMPLITADDIAAVAAAFSPDGGDIVIPVFNGKRGNPVLLGRTHFPALAELRGDRGARELFPEHPERVREAAAGPGVLADVDTPEALAQIAAETESESGSELELESESDSKLNSDSNKTNPDSQLNSELQ